MTIDFELMLTVSAGIRKCHFTESNISNINLVYILALYMLHCFIDNK